MLRFDEQERREFQALIQTGLENLNHIRDDIVRIQHMLTHPPKPLIAGQDTIIKRATAASDLPTQLLRISAAADRLVAVSEKLKQAALTRTEAEMVLTTLDDITAIGQQINKSSEAFNQIIQSAIESN